MSKWKLIIIISRYSTAFYRIFFSPETVAKLVTIATKYGLEISLLDMFMLIFYILRWVRISGIGGYLNSIFKIWFLIYLVDRILCLWTIPHIQENLYMCLNLMVLSLNRFLSTFFFYLSILVFGRHVFFKFVFLRFSFGLLSW